jgi:hypothetical protein
VFKAVVGYMILGSVWMRAHLRRTHEEGALCFWTHNDIENDDGGGDQCLFYNFVLKPLS